jgi:hypothetical protein
MFRHYRVIPRELVISTMASYVNISNAAVGILIINYTGCPTRYRIRHLFNNSNTNENTATKFEEEYVCCVRNEEECFCSVCLQCVSVARVCSACL